jgi:hypothetical protein
MWPAQQGISITLMHPVRDINEAFVAGQASAVTKSLLGPDRLAAPAGELAAVVLTDHAVAGWVKALVTLPRLGVYTLTLTNPAPPTANGLPIDYDIVVTAGISAAQNLLTSKDRVRPRMNLKNSAGQPITPGDPHELDGLIDYVISEVSDDYQSRIGRTFGQADYVEYLDGTGRCSLVLGAGPILSFASLQSVDYQDDGAGGVTEVLTTVPRHTYVLAGLASQPRYTGLGRVDMLGGAIFSRGPRRYRVAYAAGFGSVPEGIVGLATEAVIYRLMTRETGHLLSNSLGDGTTSFLRPMQMIEMEHERLLPYLLEAA